MVLQAHGNRLKYRFCPYCWKEEVSNNLARHLKMHKKKREIQSTKPFADKAKTMSAIGIRATTVGEVLKWFPEADNDFLEKLNTFKQRTVSGVIVDPVSSELAGAVEEQPAAALQRNSGADETQEAAVKDDDDEEGRSYLKNLPRLKGTRIEAFQGDPVE